MKPTGRRLWTGLGLAAIAGAIVFLVSGSLEENIVYFLTPSELAAKGESVVNEPVRLGGRVVPGSVDWSPESTELKFRLTDGTDTVAVESSGAPPAMFREGQGVVVEGRIGTDGRFRSTNLMVKHSNEYRPPDEGEEPRKAYRSLKSRSSSGDEGGPSRPPRSP